MRYIRTPTGGMSSRDVLLGFNSPSTRSQAGLPAMVRLAGLVDRALEFGDARGPHTAAFVPDSGKRPAPGGTTITLPKSHDYDARSQNSLERSRRQPARNGNSGRFA